MATSYGHMLIERGQEWITHMHLCSPLFLDLFSVRIRPTKGPIQEEPMVDGFSQRRAEELPQG